VKGKGMSMTTTPLSDTELKAIRGWGLGGCQPGGAIPGGEVVMLCDHLQEARAGIKELQAVVDAQAGDEGLWFVAQLAPEAYLQQELRRLAYAVEKLGNLLSESDA